ncbi:hypothetical protein L7F22_063943 [Adiantum nelumboides]|nr:hypothetical protein [Adiantum nelumboides]
MDHLQVIVLHGVLMWLGMGLCMPLSLILIRFLRTARQEGNTGLSGRIARGHIAVQSVGLLLDFGGGALALSNFGVVGLGHTHGRLGVALLLAPLMAAFLGMVRPEVGARQMRGLWYAAHWLLGTGTVVLTCLNIFIGLRVYELISATSLVGVNVVFFVQVALMALLYLSQNRWAYLRQVEWVLPQKAAIATGQDVMASSPTIPSHETRIYCSGKGPAHPPTVAAPSSP